MPVDPAMMREYAELYHRKLEHDDELEKIKKRINEIEPLLRTEMLIDGTESVRVGNLGPNGQKMTIYVSTTEWATLADPPEAENGEPQLTRDDMRRKAISAMEKVGIGNFVKRNWNTSTLSAWFREIKRNGEEPPPEFDGIIKLVPKTRVKARKAQ